MKLLSGVVAATVTLPRGSDEAIQGWWSEARKNEGVILFGASDLLLITADVFQFERLGDEPTGRTANTYLATALADVHNSDRRGLFRAWSFFRAQRPTYERLTVERLERLIAKFAPICRQYDVTCRVLLGYGWADLYLDLSAESFNALFAAIVACRAVTLDDPPAGVFHNAFTIVGVDFDRKDDAEKLTEDVMPRISLRVEPSELGNVIKDILPRYFDLDLWSVTVTSGKRDIFIMPRKSSVAFKEFWEGHRAIRRRIGEPGFPVHKMETHFDFEPNVVLPGPQETRQTSRCNCSADGKEVEKKFDDAAKECRRMGPGLKNSFHGLARLYLEALDGGEGCCDFDAPAAHFFSQRALFQEYQKLCTDTQAADGSSSAEARRMRRRRDLLRDVIDRLEVSSVFIFNQEQNGTYSDLLSRSERVSLYRGGMQKINVALLIAIDHLIARCALSIWPMLCWWPAGQIQSERPTGVIKVPVFYLHRPEVAFFLIIHELGQLFAYDYYRKRPLPEPDEPLVLTKEDLRLLRDANISSGHADLGRDVVEYAENRGVDTGKFATDLWADVFLLRVGFANDLLWWRNFLFEQFLDLLRSEHGLASVHVRCVHFVARLICLSAATVALAARREGADRFRIGSADLQTARIATQQYLDSAVLADRFERLITEENDVGEVLTDTAVIDKAADIADQYSHWVTEAMEHVDTIAVDAPAPADKLQQIKDGTLTEIDPSQITSYFRELLNIHEHAADATDDEKRALFLARTALISSILGSCERKPRLAKEKLRL